MTAPAPSPPSDKQAEGRPVNSQERSKRPAHPIPFIVSISILILSICGAIFVCGNDSFKALIVQGMPYEEAEFRSGLACMLRWPVAVACGLSLILSRLSWAGFRFRWWEDDDE